MLKKQDRKIYITGFYNKFESSFILNRFCKYTEFQYWGKLLNVLINSTILMDT